MVLVSKYMFSGPRVKEFNCVHGLQVDLRICGYEKFKMVAKVAAKIPPRNKIPDILLCTAAKMSFVSKSMFSG